MNIDLKPFQFQSIQCENPDDRVMADFAEMVLPNLLRLAIGVTAKGGLSQLWWVKCILRYISQELGGGTNHKDTKDTKINQSYCKLNLSHTT